MVRPVSGLDETIKIGFIGPLTGDAAFIGLADERAAEIAIDDINHAGGIRGRKIQIIAEDGRYNGKDAAGLIPAVKRIRDRKVELIIRLL